MKQTLGKATAFAPGRVELLGNHTDYNGGLVLAAALDLGVTAEGSRKNENCIELSSREVNGAIEITLPTLTQTATWADYPLGVVSELLKMGYPLGGFQCAFSSTLPRGCGLGSSAAIEVATAVLLQKLFHLDLSLMDLAKLCRSAENNFVGVSCGLLDPAASLFGKKNEIVYLDCREESIHTLPFTNEVALLIIHSGLRHGLVGGEFNDRKEQCLEAAHLLGVSQLRDATIEQVRNTPMPQQLSSRALHVVSENERVKRAVLAIQQRDFHTVGKLMNASHESSRIHFENSTPELDLLVALAQQHPEVWGARLTGAGFGGATIQLVEAQAVERVGQEIAETYIAKTDNTPMIMICEAGDGAR